MIFPPSRLEIDLVVVASDPAASFLLPIRSQTSIRFFFSVASRRPEFLSSSSLLVPPVHSSDGSVRLRSGRSLPASVDQSLVQVLRKLFFVGRVESPSDHLQKLSLPLPTPIASYGTAFVLRKVSPDVAILGAPFCVRLLAP